MCFWSYGLRKTWLGKCLKSAVSQDRLTSNMVYGPKHCWNLRNSTFTIFLDHCESKSLVLICKILGLLVNTLTADDKYSPLNRHNLFQDLQMILSTKQKTFSEFFFAFSKSRFNFENFQKKADPHSWCILELKNSEKRG